jgi:NTE family protein
MQAHQSQNMVFLLKLTLAKNQHKPGSLVFMKYSFPYSLFIFLSFGLCAQDTISHVRPKIGLTLSGGGAKGLAHIGILKAIDSAGLKIDYITGTSMGGIIGALYAVGYSADSIETLAKNIDWDLLLSNQVSLRSITMEEKSEYFKYDIELPWVNNWFRLSTGVLEGQELWLKFSELLFPVYKIKKFKDFGIPFECVATDVSTGQAVVIDSGEIISAIRASMAIPSLFTAVEYDGKKLVDGGVVRNFPVKEVREMGAKVVIGSNVSSALLSPEKVINAIQVLMQVAFFREAEDTRRQVPLCDIYVPMPLEKYSMASFSNTDEIIEAGLEEGRKLYPRLKKLADSLDTMYGPQELRVRKLPEENAIFISDYEVKGLQYTSKEFFKHALDLYTNHAYTSQGLAHMLRRASGTRYFSKISYSLQPLTDSTSKIIFDVTENPLKFAKIGLNYNQFSGISAIFNLTARDFFTPNSRSLVTVNIGQNFRARAEHLQYLGRISNFAFTLGTQFDQFGITTYSNYKEAGLFNQSYYKLDGNFSYSTSRNICIGLGSRFEWTSYSPSIASSVEFQGHNNFITSYFFIKQNTLDRAIYPKKGLKMDAEADWVFQQNPDVEIHNPVSQQDTSFSSSPYARVLINLENYAPMGRRSVFLLHLQSGINFNYQNNIMNEFSIGGLTYQFHNQLTFSGLREGTFYTPTVAEMQVGLRYQIFNSTYLTGKANVLFNNFISASKFFKNPDFLSGYSLTFSYNFVLGPLELSAMYCDQSKRMLGYVNIGIPF